MKNQLKYFLDAGLFSFLLFTSFPSLLGQMTALQAQVPKPKPSTVSPDVGHMGIMDDQHFIVMMIPHHEDAITMADLALTRAQHPEIKQLSENIKISQSQEIEQMRAWYKKWYGTDVPKVDGNNMGGGIMHGGNRGMTGNMKTMDLTALSKAKNFDQAFIEDMIPHHQMAVMMSQHLLFNAVHPEMKQLAQTIIQDQTKETNDMQSWYQQWYAAKPQ
jgi:hypothetical protein